MILTGENQRIWRKPYSIPNLCITNLTWTDLGPNQASVVTAWQLTACVIAQTMYIAIKLSLHIKIQFIPHKKLSCASIIKKNQCMLVLTESRNILCEVQTKSIYKKSKGNNVINNENTAMQRQHCFPLHYCPTSFCQQCFYSNFTSPAIKNMLRSSCKLPNIFSLL